MENVADVGKLKTEFNNKTLDGDASLKQQKCIPNLIKNAKHVEDAQEKNDMTLLSLERKGKNSKYSIRKLHKVIR